MSSYLNKNIQASCDQNILLGTTFRIMADALHREPACLSDLEESKVKSILALSGSNAESTEKVRKNGSGSVLVLCVFYVLPSGQSEGAMRKCSSVDLKCGASQAFGSCH